MFNGPVNAAFSSFGIAATHTDPVSLVATEISVIKKAPVETFSLGVDRKTTQKFMVDIRLSEISVVSRDDLIDIGANNYIVVGEPEKDTQELVWTAMLDVV